MVPKNIKEPSGMHLTSRYTNVGQYTEPGTEGRKIS